MMTLPTALSVTQKKGQTPISLASVPGYMRLLVVRRFRYEGAFTKKLDARQERIVTLKRH
jgi:hypothetical protein